MSENLFSYTKRDYESSRQEGLAKIPVLSKGNWTDLNATDPGIIILDYVHALVDMINYYQDHQALETFITTAKERANIFRLAKQFSYQIRSAKGSACDVTFTSPLLYDHPIKIPKYTSLRTADGVKYLTSVESYLPTNTASVTIPCVQGTLSTINYTGTGVSRFSNVDNARDQKITLNAKNIDIDTITIKDNIGRVWNNIDYIVFSTSEDRVFQTDLNPDNSISIIFGDGERGVVPQTTDILSISYIMTDMEQGRVAANSIINLENNILDNGIYIDFTVNNHEASIGGSSPQSSSEIRELAPGAIKAQNRAVTLSDFESLAKLVDGVADARAYDINSNPDLCLYHEVKVLIVPKNSHTASLNVLKKNVYDYLSSRMIPPTNLQILTPSNIEIDIDIVVKQIDYGIEGGLEYTIHEAIMKYFEGRAGEIGEDFYPSDLLSIISRIPYVRYIISMTPSSPVQISDLSVAKVGNITVTVQ